MLKVGNKKLHKRLTVKFNDTVMPSMTPVNNIVPAQNVEVTTKNVGAVCDELEDLSFDRVFGITSNASTPQHSPPPSPALKPGSKPGSKHGSKPVLDTKMLKLALEESFPMCIPGHENLPPGAKKRMTYKF